MCVGVCWRVTKASLETLGIGSVTHGGSQNFWKVNVLTGKWDFFLAFNGNQNYQSPKTQLYRLINANISFLLYCYRFQIKNKQLTAWKTLGMGGVDTTSTIKTLLEKSKWEARCGQTGIVSPLKVGKKMEH